MSVDAVDQPGARISGAFDELAHALVAPSGVDMDFKDRLRRSLQPHCHCMKAKQDLIAHALMVAARHTLATRAGDAPRRAITTLAGRASRPEWADRQAG